MKLNWFTRKGIIYLPTSVAGWVIFAAALVYAVCIFLYISKSSHSASDTLTSFMFNLLLTGLAYTLIGYFTERKPIPEIIEK